MSNAFDVDRHRKNGAGPLATVDGTDVIVLGGDAEPYYDKETDTTQIELDNGDLVITIGPPEPEPKQSKDFDDNLAEYLNESQLSVIAERLMRGIEMDIQSRAGWMENMSQAIALLGLEIKQPRGASAIGAAPAEGVSTVDHPLLLEAVLRFQANARGELLPTDGPVKVRNDGEGTSLAEQLATALEKDLNHYLTKTAKEYYPDTDRMLLLLGFCGISFKKGYHDPIKRRPVIASIDAKDLIVSNAATDIDGVGRVTHRQMMRPSLIKRMQIVGAYREVHLPTQGVVMEKNEVDATIDRVQGIAPPSFIEPDEQEREVYECYCEIDIPGFEHKFEGKETGLPCPYRVTLDKDSRRILEIRRNWEEDDAFCLPRNRIVAYTFIPGLGFYGIGLLNILGNATKAVTAAWRLMIDAGMFANFPGFLYLKSLAKQLTNQIRIPPGGAMPLDAASGADINKMVMPLPYKDPSAVFIQLIENVVSTAQRVGGTAETQIGEGKQDAPVGTTLALIEQATKMMSAVHKRLHQAQGQEFDMLKQLLMEDPEALWRHNKKSKVLKFLKRHLGMDQVTQEQEASEMRHRSLFVAALDSVDLVPQADPNTSSQTERYLKVVAMRQMSATNPNLDKNEIDRRAFKTMGIDDADSLFVPPQPAGMAPPSPEATTAEATRLAAQARIQDSQTKALDTQIKAEMTERQMQQTSTMKAQELEAKKEIADKQLARELVIHQSDSIKAQQQQAQQQHADAVSSAADRAHEMQMEGVGRAHDVRMAGLEHARDTHSSALDHAHDVQMAGLENRHDILTNSLQNHRETREGVADRLHEAVQTGIDRRHEAHQNALDRHADSLTAMMQARAKATQGISGE